MANTHPIPNALALASATRPSLAVYDGQTRLGHLVRRDAGFEAIDINGVSHGTHADMRTAAFAIPARSTP
jgi:hypothetical protein